MSELKPCPFCGRQPYESGGYVSCHTELCLANADYHEPAIGSITDWNTRPIEDALNARITELEVALQDVYDEWITCDDDWWTDEVAELKEKVVRILNDLPEVQG